MQRTAANYINVYFHARQVRKNTLIQEATHRAANSITGAASLGYWDRHSNESTHSGAKELPALGTILERVDLCGIKNERQMSTL